MSESASNLKASCHFPVRVTTPKTFISFSDKSLAGTQIFFPRRRSGVARSNSPNSPTEESKWQLLYLSMKDNIAFVDLPFFLSMKTMISKFAIEKLLNEVWFGLPGDYMGRNVPNEGANRDCRFLRFLGNPRKRRHSLNSSWRL